MSTSSRAAVSPAARQALCSLLLVQELVLGVRCCDLGPENVPEAAGMHTEPPSR